MASSSDLFTGSIFGGVFILAIGLFFHQIATAEISWGVAFIFIVFLLISHH